MARAIPAPVGLEIVPLSAALGAEVRGLDLSRPLDQATFEAIRAAWLEHLVLLFRGQAMSDAHLVAFSRRFGALDIAPPNENGQRFVEGHPEILVISNVVEHGIEIGSLGAGEAIWHSDMSYLEAPPTGSLLLALEVPAEGGDTGFCNLYRALSALPPDLAALIAGKTIKHDATTNSAGYLREGSEPVTDVTRSPGASHPIVRSHPDTGRPILFLGRRRNAYVDGLPLKDSEALLDALWAHATDPAFTWHHHWRPGDLLLWDNRAVLHRRDPFDDSARRIMHRTQIKGTRVV
jgi:taurine dioxygenase